MHLSINVVLSVKEMIGVWITDHDHIGIPKESICVQRKTHNQLVNRCKQIMSLTTLIWWQKGVIIMLND